MREFDVENPFIVLLKKNDEYSDQQCDAPGGGEYPTHRPPINTGPALGSALFD